MAAAERPQQDASVVVTIDTEPDNAWEDHLNPSVANVRELLRLQELLGRYGASPTCMVTSRVLQSAEAVDVLRELVAGGAEIGAHLHPWESPPFVASGMDTRHPTFPHELPVDVFEDKLRGLIEAISERFDAPTSYRGGRWGIATEHLPILEAAGLEVDTTVTPLVDWRSTMGIPARENGTGGVDFRFAPTRPYHPNYEDVTSEGDARITEIPLTVGFTRRLPAIVRRTYFALPELGRRLMRKLGLARPVLAEPAGERVEWLTKMVRVVLAQRPPAVNIALHSSELMVGGSPWSKTRADVDRIFSRMDSILRILSAEHSCVFTTLTDAARRWNGTHAQ